MVTVISWPFTPTVSVSSARAGFAVFPEECAFVDGVTKHVRSTRAHMTPIRVLRTKKDKGSRFIERRRNNVVQIALSLKT